MSSLSAVLSARAALSDLTPLLTDCGRLCGFACCKGDEQTGMLLFPGEEALFAPCAFGRVIPAHFELAGRPAHLFVCNGTCSRENRPLAACFRFSCISKKTARRASNSTSAQKPSVRYAIMA
mgnify:CR=1 FL=1